MKIKLSVKIGAKNTYELQLIIPKQRGDKGGKKLLTM